MYYFCPQVKYKFPFEPYILMRTKEMPLYFEDVLDRMQDKALSAEVLSKRG